MGWVQIGMLSGLAALAIPIIVHLVFGRRARRVELGTLRFLKIVLLHDIRRKKLKRWLLLALRMACVALLVFLFARPYLVASQTGGEDSLVILLLDRSASMELKQGGRRVFDTAVRQATEIVARCGEATRIEAAWFDHAVHPLGATEDFAAAGSAASVAERLRAAGSSRDLFGATDYGAAMAWAGDVAAQSKHRRKELYLFTDLQRSGLERTAASPLPEELAVHLVDLGRAYPENVAVTAAALPKLVARPGEAMSVNATVRNTGPFARETVPVILRLEQGGRWRDFRSQARLEAGGTATVRFDLPALEEGLWQGFAAAEVEDDLAFDNRRHVAFLVARPIRVVLVDGSPGALPVTAETFFLETAIRLAEPSKSFAGSPFTATVVPHASGRGLPDLGNASLVVLANVGDLSAPDARRLADSVRRGGGLVVFTGDNVLAAGCRNLAAAGLCPGRIGPVVPADSLPWRLESWDCQHPVFRPFGDPQHGDLRRLAFRAYTRIEPAGDAKVLARFRGGDPAVLEKPLGSGKVLWLATSCGLDWGDWPRSRLYVPMVHQLLGYLAGLTEGGPVRNVVLDEVAEGKEALPGVFARAGFSEVINADPRESETERCSPEQFAARFHFTLPSGDDASSSEQAARDALGDQQRPDEIWHWVILGLLGCLLLESFLGNRTVA
jgi:hypothetical protein